MTSEEKSYGELRNPQSPDSRLILSEKAELPLQEDVYAPSRESRLPESNGRRLFNWSSRAEWVNATLALGALAGVSAYLGYLGRDDSKTENKPAAYAAAPLNKSKSLEGKVDEEVKRDPQGEEKLDEYRITRGNEGGRLISAPEIRADRYSPLESIKEIDVGQKQINNLPGYLNGSSDDNKSISAAQEKSTEIPTAPAENPPVVINNYSNDVGGFYALGEKIGNGAGKIQYDIFKGKVESTTGNERKYWADAGIRALRLTLEERAMIEKAAEVEERR